jgi:uncharacterized protein YndB with AHSA1/START domain
MQTNLSIEVKASPETVFKWLVDPACIIQWLPNVTEYRFTNSATPSVGTHLEQVWNDEGAMTKFEGEITVYELNKSYGLHLNNKNTQVDVLYTLKKSGANTHLTQETTFQYSGMMKLIDKVAAPAIQKSYIDQAKQNFSRLIELCTD